MIYDDIANNSENPFPGKLFNKPSSGPGIDIYADCKIDYKNWSVNPENFLAVLTGGKTTGGNNRVLKSGANDTVFIRFSDHGAAGMIAFPDSNLYADQLLDAFKTMQ